MKTYDLLLSGLSITEDEYDYKGLFFLSFGDISVKVDMAELQNNSRINELKKVFSLEEDTNRIRGILMDMIMEKASISSKITEGKEYVEKTDVGAIGCC